MLVKVTFMKVLIDLNTIISTREIRFIGGGVDLVTNRKYWQYK